ncbi:hypothetical protein PRBEI_2000835200 [Prionailurus iriomotensis]
MEEDEAAEEQQRFSYQQRKFRQRPRNVCKSDSGEVELLRKRVHVSSKEAIEMKEKKQPLDFPGLGSSRLVPYGGHRDTGREAREAAKRQEVPPPQQSLQEQTPCKDFFRKTFSSCK